MKYFEDLEIGLKVTFLDQYDVTEEEIIEVGVRWDPQPYHTGKEKAQAFIFGGLVASSSHIFSMFSRIGHDPIDEENTIAAATAMGFTNLKWHNPVRPNDIIKATYEIASIRESKSKPDLGIVGMEHTLFNPNREYDWMLPYVSELPVLVNVERTASLVDRCSLTVPLECWGE
jgi:acyl dehydratase